MDRENVSSSPGSTTETPPPPSDNSNSSPPAAADTSSPPPAAAGDTSSPPPPAAGDTSSPPPPDSTPPPPTPPPPDSKSPPPPEQKSSSPPPPDEQQSSPSPPPSRNSPSPKNSPSPPPSEKSPATPPPENSSSENSPPPPSGGGGNPPATDSPPVFSPPGARNPGGGGAPPPPPTARRLSPPARSSDSGGSREVSPPAVSSSSASVSAGVIAAAVVIVVGILAAVVICLVCAARKKKRRRYYMDTPGSTRAKGDYYNGSNWNTPQNLRPPPGVMNTTPGGGIATWVPPTPPPLVGNTSSEYSYSGGPPHANPTTPSPNMALSNQSSFSYEELAQATTGFSQENLLGQGGFGYVHKGVLPSGKEVAVKSLKSGSGQGEREFQAEVEIISRVHHRHLVSLVGYCIADGQRMLVYEFVSNKTLEFHLHGNDRPTMDWPTRMRIALGAAKGLGYLHEDCHPRIIHRDIKAANILLDDNFEAMVADFGLAKLTSDNYTHVSTRVMGTFGYMAPEYASSGKLTDKSDVFSFGVMMLELITGRKPIDLTNKTMDDSLVDWARPILGHVLDNGNYEEIVDPRLGNNFDPHEMDRMIACASASIRHSARKRPKMSQIVRSLEGDQSSLDDTAIKSGQTPETTTYDTTAYNADMMKFKKMVMNSNGYGSSEFEQTSEYGLNPSSSSSDLGSREHTNSGAQRQRL